MRDLHPKRVIGAAGRLIDEIGDLAECDELLDLDRLEQSARVLCGHLKAVQAVEAHNLYYAAQHIGQKYTRYEDLPPLRPEERDRLKQDFIDLLAPRGIAETEPKPKQLPKPSKTQH